MNKSAIPYFIKKYSISDEGVIRVQLNVQAFDYKILENAWNNSFVLPTFEYPVEFVLPQIIDTQHSYTSSVGDAHTTHVALLAHNIYPAGTELAVSRCPSHDSNREQRKDYCGFRLPNGNEIWFHEPRADTKRLKALPFIKGFEHELSSFFSQLPKKGTSTEIPNTVVAGSDDIVEHMIEPASLIKARFLE